MAGSNSTQDEHVRRCLRLLRFLPLSRSPSLARMLSSFHSRVFSVFFFPSLASSRPSHQRLAPFRPRASNRRKDRERNGKREGEKHGMVRAWSRWPTTARPRVQTPSSIVSLYFRLSPMPITTALGYFFFFLKTYRCYAA